MGRVRPEDPGSPEGLLPRHQGQAGWIRPSHQHLAREAAHHRLVRLQEQDHRCRLECHHCFVIIRVNFNNPKCYVELVMS